MNVLDEQHQTGMKVAATQGLHGRVAPQGNLLSVMRRGGLAFCVLLALSGFAAGADEWDQAAELLKSGQARQAEEAYSKLVEKLPDDARGYLGRGRALWRLKKLDAAIADFDVVIALNPKSADAYNVRALANEDKGEKERCIPDFDRAIELVPKSAVYRTNRADAFFKLGQADKALEDFNKAIELDPKLVYAYNSRASFLTSLGHYDRAIADADKALSINSRDTTAYINRATAYGNQGEDDKAMADFNNAAELDPSSAKVFSNRGYFHSRHRNYDLALADYSKAIELAPKVAQNYSNRGAVWLKKGNYPKAMEDVDAAIALNPNYSRAFRARASVWLAQGKYENAIVDSSQAIELKRDEAGAFRLRSEARAAMGDIKGAQDDACLALVLGPQPGSGRAAAVSLEILAREQESLNALRKSDAPENRLRLAAVRRDHASAILNISPQAQSSEVLEEALAYARSAALLEPGNAGNGALVGTLSKKLAAAYFKQASDLLAHYDREPGDTTALESALGDAKKATILGASSAPNLYLLGTIYARFPNDPLASALAESPLQMSLKIDPGNIPCRLALARLFLRRGAYPAALDAMQECVGKDPQQLDRSLAADMCRAYVSANQAPRGEQFFLGAVKARPESSTARLALALLIRAQGRNDEALRQLEALTGDKKSSAEDAEFSKKLLKSWQEKKR